MKGHPQSYFELFMHVFLTSAVSYKQKLQHVEYIIPPVGVTFANIYFTNFLVNSYLCCSENVIFMLSYAIINSPKESLCDCSQAKQVFSEGNKQASARRTIARIANRCCDFASAKRGEAVISK